MTALWWQAIMLQSVTLWLWWLISTASSLSSLAYATKKQYSSSCRSSAFCTSMILTTPVSSLRVTRVRPAISFSRTMRASSPTFPFSNAESLSARSCSTCRRHIGATTVLMGLLLDSLNELAYQLSRGLNCINVKLNQSYISMSKKLWQAIGVWNSSPPSPHQPQQPEMHNSNPLDSYAEQIVVTSSCGVDEDGVGKQEGLSLQIESCQSEQLRSDANRRSNASANNGEIPWCSSNLFNQKAFKTRMAHLAQQVKQLQAQLKTVRTTVQNELLRSGRDVLTILDSLSQQMSKPAEAKPVIVACHRCDQSKTLIDQLTRQCWQLEAKLKEKDRADDKVSKEETPMKKIENSLLQERGEAMKRLKSEVQELHEENEGLYLKLSQKDQQLQEMELQYKKSLLAFKTQIEVIDQACCSKIEQIIQEKVSVEAQLHLMKEKYSALQETTEVEQIRRNIDKRYFTQHPQTFTFPTTIELQSPFLKQPGRQAQTPHSRNISSRNTTSLIDLDISQNDSLSHPNNNRQPYLQAPKKNHLFFQTPSHSKQTIKSSEWSTDNPFQRLQQLQRGVRKEINRSKKSIK